VSDIAADVLYIGIMKTTVDIPDELLKQAMLYSKSSTKREAVLAALEEYNRRNRQAEMVKYLGTFKDFMTSEELLASRQEREVRHEKQRRGK
jgi:Arc/MetJ family transcription regulator